MPNGDPDFDLAEQERWFQPIASTIESFAQRHNLLLEKYYHDGPSWFLRFAHPKGGSATIQISNRKDIVGVMSYWHVDDYDRSSRYLHWGVDRTVAKDVHALEVALDETFRYILTREYGDWNQVAEGYKRIWGRYSKAEFEAMEPRHPKPRFDEI